MLNTPETAKVIPNGIDGIAPVVPEAQSEAVKAKPENVLPREFYDYFLSKSAQRRKPNAIRHLFPLEEVPGVISLLAGKPNASTFPFTSLSFTARSPTDPSDNQQFSLTEPELNEGLQYGMVEGQTGFNRWLAELQEMEHKRRYDVGEGGENWRLCITTGSQDGLYKTIHALVNPGDPVLVESSVYAGVLPIFDSLECEIIEIGTDAQGIITPSLSSNLESWPPSKPKPKVLYTVPYGSNPSGVTTSLERRLDVLKLARQHKFLILEDDPYYYLYFGTSPRIPSYFNLEAQTGTVGHVVRFDSLSKILSAGIRIGFVTGPIPILNAIDMHTTSINLQPCSLVQSIVFALLQQWGYSGFMEHTRTVAEFYRKKRDVFETAMQDYLGKEGLAEWSTPNAGMFFWFKLLLSPDAQEVGDSETIIRTKAFENGVLALPGTVFLPNGQKTGYVRASFSLLSEAEVREALRRLRDVILAERERRAGSNF